MKHFLFASVACSSLFAAQECFDDCICYVPQYHNLQCDWGVFVEGAYLRWFAKETGLSYALKVQTVANAFETGFINTAIPKKFEWIEESWDPGFRIGGGFNWGRDGWDLYVSWTQFQTSDRQSVSTPKQFFDADQEMPLGEFLLSPWVSPASFITISTSDAGNLIWFTSITSKWKLRFNLIDLELGRKYCLSRCFSLRPYIGARGGRIKTRFDTNPTQEVLQTFNPMLAIDFLSKHVVKFKNEFEGIGLLGGLQPNWHACWGFSFFGNADIALLWGHFDIKRIETQDFLITEIVSGEPIGDIESNFNLSDSKNKFTAMQAILDLAAGVRWERSFCCDRFLLSADVSWEHHIWFDHNHRNQLIGQFTTNDNINIAFQSYDEKYGNLILGGLVVRGRIDF